LKTPDVKKEYFSILVNSTDSFEDCWLPFFKLFKIYWPNYEGKIYLNTETKEYKYQNLNIISCKNHASLQKKILWGECLMRALDMVQDDLILYMQEDYFLKDTVKIDIIEDYARMMRAHQDIHCIHLTDQAVMAGNKSMNYDGLYTIALNQRYRISCQAALWQKDILYNCLRPYENAWQFEEFGSKREVISRHNFYVVDQHWVKNNQFEIVPYIFTGIVKKRWNEEVVPLFEKHGIKIDYAKRGFLKDAPKRSLKMKIRNKCCRIHLVVKNYFEIRKLQRQGQ
jgi:hypothetical protein